MPAITTTHAQRGQSDPNEAGAPVSPESVEHVGGRLEFEELISDLSSRFVNLAPGDVVREIEDAQRRVCEALGLDLAALWEGSVGAGALTLTHFHSSGHERSTLVRGMNGQELFPWVHKEMLAGRMVVARSLEDLPPGAAFDRESFRAFGVHSTLVLPLSVGGASPMAALGFNTMREEREWPEPLVKRLQLIGQVFGNALARKRADLVLRESEERLALAADSAEAGLWTLDYRSGAIWVTERTRAIFEFAPGEPVTVDRLRAAVLPEDWGLVAEAIERSKRSTDLALAEYRIVLPRTGEVRWIDSRGRAQFDAAGQPQRLLGLSIDVTERKRGEEALRAGQGRLEAAADLAGLAFYEVDFGTGSVLVDDTLPRRVRDPSGAAPGPAPARLLDRAPSPRRPRARAGPARAAARRTAGAAHHRVPLPSPAVAASEWLHHVARVTARDEGGRVVRTFGVLRDITERRLREDALRRSHAEIEQLKDRLQAESDYLKAEIRVAHRRGEVTGQSPAIQKVLRLGPAGGADRVHGARPRRDGHGQGARRPGDPPDESPARARDGEGELRRAAVGAGGERAVRPREGRLHRAR